MITCGDDTNIHETLVGTLWAELRKNSCKVTENDRMKSNFKNIIFIYNCRKQDSFSCYRLVKILVPCSLGLGLKSLPENRQYWKRVSALFSSVPPGKCTLRGPNPLPSKYFSIIRLFTSYPVIPRRNCNLSC